MLADNLKKVRDRITTAAQIANRDPAEIKLVAVSKTFLADKILELFNAGQFDFAENYVQEADEKIQLIKNEKINWHFIGHIQSNKVKNLVNKYELIHSVDRLKIAQEISQKSLSRQKILIEINLAGEKSKSGLSEKEVFEQIEDFQKLEHIQLAGLMFMPPLNLNLNEQKYFFEKFRILKDKLAKNVSRQHNFDELSMGTSHDFEIAIEQGATLIRLGTILFGERS